MWATGVTIMLAMFYVVDRRNFARAPKAVREMETAQEAWRFDGLANLFFLAVILGAVFVRKPLFVREGLMIGAALGSYFTTKKQVHEANHFNFHPIQEVAILFVGIFLTMMPAMDWLSAEAEMLLGKNPGCGLFYWGSGILSSVLDNAPTYLAFLNASFGTFVDPDVVQQVQAHIATGTIDFNNLTGVHAEQIRHTLEALQKYHGAEVATHGVSLDEIKVCFLLGNPTYNKYILAISVGAVFFGACTYIGNGPNFMVKAIADQQKIRTPAFLGYVGRYALPFMLPMLLVVWWLFFKN
jgi:Na+/H+ antiporter NhaD/arsenite permease-like protein